MADPIKAPASASTPSTVDESPVIEPFSGDEEYEEAPNVDADKTLKGSVP